jgi:alpha-beta hydrolase superfamily lysophospholipase
LSPFGDPSTEQIVGTGWPESMSIADRAYVSWFGPAPHVRAYGLSGSADQPLALPGSLRSVHPGSLTAANGHVAFTGLVTGSTTPVSYRLSPGRPAAPLPNPSPAAAAPYQWCAPDRLVGALADAGRTVVALVSAPSGETEPLAELPSELDPGLSAAQGRLIHLAPSARGMNAPALVLHDLHSKSHRVLMKSAPGRVLRRAQLAPDGVRVACVLATAAGPELRLLDLDRGYMSSPVRIESEGRPRWSPDSSSVSLVTDHWPRRQVVVVDAADGSSHTWAVPGQSVTDVGYLPEGGHVVIASDYTSVPGVYRLMKDDRVTRLAFAGGQQMPGTVDQPRPPSGDVDIPCLRVAPQGQCAGVVVMVHGGPASAWYCGFSPFVTALVEAGFSVVLANPRGSTVPGVALPHLAPGRYGVDDASDVEAVCRHVMSSLPAGTPLFLFGHSYGGFLANQVATHLVGQVAGLVLSSSYARPHDLLDCSEPARRFLRHAWPTLPPTPEPVGFAVPTLMVHGEEDPTVPLEVARDVFGREARAGCRFVVLAGEAHSARSPRGLAQLTGAVLSFLIERCDHNG